MGICPGKTCFGCGEVPSDSVVIFDPDITRSIEFFDLRTTEGSL